MRTWIVTPAPFPEERLDLWNIRTARYVLDRLVIDSHDCRTNKWLACGICELHFDFCLLARLVFLGRRQDFDVQDPLLRRNDDFAHLAMKLAVTDGHCFHKEIWHILLGDLDLLQDALALHAYDLRRQVYSVGGPGEEQDGATRAIGVDHELDLLARLIFTLVGNQLDVVEPIFLPIKALAHDTEQVPAFNAVTLRIGDLVGQPVLAGSRGLELLCGLALNIRVQLPFLDSGLDRLVVFVPNSIQHQLAFAGHRLVVQRHGREAGVDGVANAVMAAIYPGIDLERLASYQHAALPHNCSAGIVCHLGSDLVLVISITVQFLSNGCIYLDLVLSILTDLDFAFGNDLGRTVPRRPPPHVRASAAPVMPAGVPVIVICEPPVAWLVEPVPDTCWIPVGGVRIAMDLVLQLRFRNRCAEVVLGVDRRDYLLAQHDRLGRSVDLNLELRLLVFLDPERSAAVTGNIDAVYAQRSIARQLVFTVQPAVLVRLETLLKDLLALGVIDSDRERLASER